ncbi:MAG: hypothetical protein J5I50_06260 [Chitinophagaceae bacterium]|nr:hypothetical protein [Chitinophagaceae bacterium]
MIENPFEQIMTELAEIKTAISKPQPIATPDEIISREELQKRLGVTEPTLIRYGRKGIIPELRLGSNVRYNWPDVLAALSNVKTLKK